MTKEILERRKVKNSEELQDFLLHIGWSEVLKPELDKYVGILQNYLVKAVLGQKIITTSFNQSVEISKEQIAGQIEGIKFVEDMLLRIIKEGERGVDYLRDLSGTMRAES
jgi:hypothetical protein